MKNNKYGEDLGLSRSRFLRQPIENVSILIDTALKSIEQCGFIHFIYFWGISPQKKAIDRFDKQSMAFLNLLIAHISYTFSEPVKLTILFGDIHAFSNYISNMHVEEYYSNIEKICNTYNFEIIKLSAFFSTNELKRIYIPNTESKILYEKHSSNLIKAAVNTGSKETADERAKRYLSARILEKQKLKEKYKSSIILTGDRPINKYILPDMPIIYTYTIGYKKNHKAWFLTE